MRCLMLPKKAGKQIAGFIKKAKKVREYKRAKVVLLVSQGYKMTEVAKLLGVSYSMVRKCISRYRRGEVNSFTDAPRSGRPPKIKPAHIKYLREVIRKVPKTAGYDRYWWNCNLLSQEIKRIFRVQVTDEWIRRLLIGEGYRFRRPKLHISSPDPNYDIKKTV